MIYNTEPTSSHIVMGLTPQRAQGKERLGTVLAPLLTHCCQHEGDTQATARHYTEGERNNRLIDSMVMKVLLLLLLLLLLFLLLILILIFLLLLLFYYYHYTEEENEIVD